MARLIPTSEQSYFHSLIYKPNNDIYAVLYIQTVQEKAKNTALSGSCAEERIEEQWGPILTNCGIKCSLWFQAVHVV